MKNIRIFLSALVIFLLIGCSDFKKDAVTTAPTGVAFHSTGNMEATSSEFHGEKVKEANWDVRTCKRCHGSSYDGGTASKSCLTCHTKTNGPENCATCHGSANNAPPKDLNRNTAKSKRGVGAHQNHYIYYASNTSVTTGTCEECHKVPTNVFDNIHLDGNNRAEVLFNAILAKKVTNRTTDVYYNSSQPTYSPTPVYDSLALTCANIYCHGYFRNGNLTFKPTWNDTTGASGKCGTCHGDATTSGLTQAQRALPKTSSNDGTHPNDTNCRLCHSPIVNASAQIANTAKHIDGLVTIDHPDNFTSTSSNDFHGNIIRSNSWDFSGCKTCHGSTYAGISQKGSSCLTCHTKSGGPENCTVCHGSTNSAPPRDLSKNTSISARGVGAHQVHLTDSTRFKVVACAECHNVPMNINDSGHLDGDNKAEITFNGPISKISIGGGLTPSPAYNSTILECSNTYCHGYFKNGNNSFKPIWNDATGASGKCGTCHGDANKVGATMAGKALPSGTHLQVENCSFCHGNTVTVDGSGNVTHKDPKKHVNGVVDF